MERLDQEQHTGGLTAAALRLWGMLFLLAGIIGKCVLQNRFLGMTDMSGKALLDAMNASQNVMILATVALVCQVLEACAVPIFAFLLVEGFQKTKSRKNYFLRVAGTAALSEIPYNLAIGGKLLVLDSRNPVFGILVCLVVLYLFRHYSGKDAGKIVIKIVVAVAAAFWCRMLNVQHGAFLVLLTTVLWAVRDRQKIRVFAGAIAAVLGSLFSLLNLAAPMSFLAINYYNGEKGESSRYVTYLCYPVLLMAVYAAALLI